ncbi:MAG: twitching motility protein PilT [Pseudopedobacter saltans]|uniref:Twitching motility protein PilT n=1 Tax=Pseudopedobacter saltans TaxID=151895 RepID=A0A2W5HAE6_9SPHI|nr:MAG: twitching motility protein PilT [Pseudopedobacter saltans]
MRIFLDANILIAVLNKEYPLFSKAARILSLTENPRFEVYTSPLCLAIAFYFSGKKSGESMARQKIALLSEKVKVCNTNAATVTKTIQNSRIHDFEDGLQYYSAKDVNCQVIITENQEDFYFSDIAIRNSEAFLKEYVF